MAFQIKIDKKIETAITCSAFFLALILLYVFLGRPVLRFSEKLKAEFKKSQDKLKESEQLIRSFPNPQKEIADLENKAQELRDMGASTRQLPRIIQLLAIPANKLNINVTSIRPREDIAGSNEALPTGVTKVYIELSMNCPYQAFAEYAKAISELPTSFIVERLSVEKRTSEEGSAETNRPEGRGLASNSQSQKTSDKAGEKPEELSITLLLSTYLILEI